MPAELAENIAWTAPVPRWSGMCKKTDIFRQTCAMLARGATVVVEDIHNRGEPIELVKIVGSEMGWDRLKTTSLGVIQGCELKESADSSHIPRYAMKFEPVEDAG